MLKKCLVMLSLALAFGSIAGCVRTPPPPMVGNAAVVGSGHASYHHHGGKLGNYDGDYK